MQVDIQEAGPCKKRLKIAVPRDKYREKLDKNYADLANTITVPGFRKGRVPRQLLEKRFGKHVEEELKQSLIRETTDEALNEHKLQPIGEPTVEKVEFDGAKEPPLEFEVTVAVKPEFEVPDAAAVKVERPVIAVTDVEVKESLEAMRRARGELKAKAEDAAVEPDDFLIVDVEYVDPEAAPGEVALRKDGVPLFLKNEVLEGTPVPGLTNKLAGVRRDQTVEVDVTLSDRFQTVSLRNKPARARITIKELKQAIYPEIDDAFAADSGFADLKEMHEEVRSRLLRAKDQEADHIVEDRIVEAMLEKVTFDLPEDLVAREVEEQVRREGLKLRYAGKSQEEVEADAEKHRTSARDDVAKRLKALFLLDKIARDEKIFVTEDEVHEAIAAMAARSGRPEPELHEELEQTGAVNRVRAELRSQKTLKLLRGKAQVVDAENR